MIVRVDLLACLHEAGHALGFLASGVPFEYVTVGLADGGGVVACEAWPSITHPVRAVLSHAGPLAQAQHQLLRYQTPGPPNGHRDYFEGQAYRSGADRDLEVIRGSLRALGLTTDPFQPKARALLNRNWPAVERIATALTDQHELAYTDVVALAGRDLR